MSAIETRSTHFDIEIAILREIQLLREAVAPFNAVQFADIAADIEAHRAVFAGGTVVNRSTGSGGSGSEMLSAGQQAALKAWNDANPDMKMTAKEFLGR